MSQVRPRIRTDTTERLAQITGTIDEFDAEAASVDEQIRALAAAYVERTEQCRTLGTRLRARRQQLNLSSSSSSGGLFSDDDDDPPGRTPRRSRR